jgi:hypothetical protein
MSVAKMTFDSRFISNRRFDMPVIEDEIKGLAEQIWPDHEIEVGPNRLAAKGSDAAREIQGYAVYVRDSNGKPIEKVKAGSLEKLLEGIELRLSNG